MRTVLIFFYLLVGPSVIFSQKRTAFSGDLKEKRKTAYIAKGKEAFKKWGIQLDSQGDDFITGIHNQKKIWIGWDKVNAKSSLITEGIPPGAVRNLHYDLLDYLNSDKGGATVLANIEVEVVVLIDDRPRAVSKDYGLNPNKPFSVYFANLPISADKIVIAKSSSPDDEWIAVHPLYAGKLTNAKGSPNFGAVDFTGLPNGKYEARILSELKQPVGNRKHRTLQYYPFEIDNRAHLDILKPKDCAGLSRNIPIKVYKNNQVIFSSPGNGPDEISLQLEPGDYEVEFDIPYLPKDHRIPVKVFVGSIATYAPQVGNLSLRFLDKLEKPSPKKNCTVILLAGNKEVFRKEYASIHTESWTLPEGTYTAEIVIPGKPTLKKQITVIRCREFKFDSYDETPIQVKDESKGKLIIHTEEAGCTGRDMEAGIEIKQNGNNIASNWGPKADDKNTFEQKQPPYQFELNPGVYDVTITTIYATYVPKQRTYIPIQKTIEIKTGSDLILSRGQYAGKLEIRFFDISGAPLKVQNYKITILQGEKQLYYSSWWYPTEYDAGLLPIGNYEVKIGFTSSKTKNFETQTKQVSIAPCQTVTLDFQN